MYQRELSWETYLHRYGWRDDTTRGLQRLSPPPVTLAGYSGLVALSEEARQILERGMETADPRTVTPENLRSSFDWAMGSVIWKLELLRPGLLELVGPARAKTNPAAMETRARAERAYLNGGYAEALKGYQSIETAYSEDFTLFLTLGHLQLYHQHPPELDRAASYYLKAASLAGSRAPMYAGRALLFAAFVAYLQRNDALALDRARQTATVMPPWIEAWFSQARFAALCSQPELAMPALEQAVRLDRNYALRAAACPDFAPLENQVTALFERLREDARLQAEAQARTLQIETSASPVPSQYSVNSQQLQAEIAERWKQNTYFGYLDAAGKMVRFKVYLEGLHLSERDRIMKELAPALIELHAGLEQQTSNLPAGLQAQMKALMAAGEAVLANPPTQDQAQAALDQVRQAKALWQLATSQVSLSGHTGEINVLAFSPAGRWLASTGSWDLSLRLWDTHTGALAALLNGHNDIIHALAFSPDGQVLASAGGDYKGRDFTIRLWDVAAGRSQRILEGHTNQVTALAVQPSGQLLASASADYGIRLWSLPSGDQGIKLDGHTAGATCLAWSPDGSLLVSGGEDQAIRIWDVKNGDQVGLLLGHETALIRLLITPDGKTLISQGDDETLRLWNLPDRQLLAVLDQPGKVNALALSPDGSQMAWSTGVDGLVRLWTPGSPQPPQVLEGHSGRVTSLAFSPDGLLLASGSEDGLVRLWGPATGAAKAIRSGHDGKVGCLAFSPDITLLASGGLDKNVHLWGLVLTEADHKMVADDAQERARRAEEERQARLAEQERQRQAWRSEGRCEICGAKLGLMDKLSSQVRCKEHR